jgi:hypothetical protein
VLGLLGAASGGALLGFGLRGGAGIEGEVALLVESHEQVARTIKIEQEQATRIKLQAAELAKQAFARDGYRGIRQSDRMTAEFRNATTHLSVLLDFTSGGKSDVLDFGVDDLEAVAITYATLDGQLGESGGEEVTQGTIPPVSSNGTASRFSLEVFQQTPKVAPPLPGAESMQPALPAAEYFLRVNEFDVNVSADTQVMPLKPPTYETAITGALDQFSTGSI